MRKASVDTRGEFDLMLEFCITRYVWNEFFFPEGKYSSAAY